MARWPATWPPGPHASARRIPGRSAALIFGLLWAWGFNNPIMVYGLAGASIPVIIHLLNRRKFRETSWAAMQFLLAAIRKNYRRIRVEQWILLAIRTLV